METIRRSFAQFEGFFFDIEINNKSHVGLILAYS